MFLHTFASEIAALGFDRLLWIRYLKRYTEIVTKKRVVIICITIGAHSTFQAASFFFESKYITFLAFEVVAGIIDILIVLFIIFFICIHV